MNAQELMVAYGTSLLVRKGRGSAPWYEAIKWFPGQMSGLSGNLGRLSSNLDTLYSNQGGLSSNPSRGKMMLFAGRSLTGTSSIEFGKITLSEGSNIHAKAYQLYFSGKELLRRTLKELSEETGELKEAEE